MPKKKYNDDRLRDEMLTLRRQGFTYREIAVKLGCSTYKVHELISPFENPNMRLRQAAELADKLSILTGRAEALEKRLASLEERLAKLKVLEDLQTENSKLGTGLRQLGNRLSMLEEKLVAEVNELRSLLQRQQISCQTTNQKLSGFEVAFSKASNQIDREILNLKVRLDAEDSTFTVRFGSVEERVAKIENDLALIYVSAIKKVDGKHACKHIDKEGYCKHMHSPNVIKNCGTKQIVVNGQKQYILNVRDKPLICAACPSYKPK